MQAGLRARIVKIALFAICFLIVAKGSENRRKKDIGTVAQEMITRLKVWSKHEVSEIRMNGAIRPAA